MQHMTQAISVTLMRSQIYAVILQAAYNGHVPAERDALC